MADRKHSEVAHTPGPWKEYAPAIACEKNSPFKMIDENYRYISAGRRFDGRGTHEGFTLTGFISPEDARLIAAAPELLEALILAAKCCGANLEVKAIAEAAIRKAKRER